jgi:nucleoside-triphosphatase THEP1
MHSIFIHCGSVHSGKTTRLIKWLKDKNNVQGIISPIIAGKRYLVNINSDEKRKLEIDSGSSQENVTKIGNYIFDKSVFEWACKIILDAVKSNPDWLIIDEVGPLELQGEGLAKAVNKVFSENVSLLKTNVIMVVRERLLNDFLNHYNLTEKDINYFNDSI